MRMLKRALAASAALVAAVAIQSCASYPVQASWNAKEKALPRGLVVEIGPEKGGVANFRMRGDELGGAILEGEARPSEGSWILEVERLDWLGNWAEGWTEAGFVAEGTLRLRPLGPSWLLEVEVVPRIENPVNASIRLFGDYFEGEKALALLSHRWDRIQAVDGLLKEKYPDAWYDYSEPRNPAYFWTVFARRISSFQAGVGPFLFPELYGYPKTDRPADRGPFLRAESIDWDSEYTKEQFPENLRAIRDSGTMFRDFEEGAGLWRLDFCWEALWRNKIGEVTFHERQRTQ